MDQVITIYTSHSLWHRCLGVCATCYYVGEILSTFTISIVIFSKLI